jgi:hypothetical protein
MIFIMIHYVSAHIYTWYCTPLSWYGFFISPFIVSTPHCKALRWSIQTFSVNIETMWHVFGTWLATIFLQNQHIHTFLGDSKIDKI